MKKCLFALVLLLCATSAIASSKTYNGVKKAVTTDYPHHEIHGGNSFCVSINNASSGTGESDFLLINTPTGDTYAHMLVNIRASGEARIEVWEDTTVSAVGSALVEANHNRNSSNAALTEVTQAPTLTSAGTRINGFTQHVGSGVSKGGESGRSAEIVLGAGKLYLINAVSESAANDVSISLDWYESKDFY